jgi:hypothetical protein
LEAAGRTLRGDSADARIDDMVGRLRAALRWSHHPSTMAKTGIIAERD